jgi:hypothetical protein
MKMLKDGLQDDGQESRTRPMPVIGQKRKKESWLQRKIRACRFLAGFLRYWGPLAFREIIEDWRSALAADRRLGDGDGTAEWERPSNSDVGLDVASR